MFKYCFDQALIAVKLDKFSCNSEAKVSYLMNMTILTICECGRH